MYWKPTATDQPALQTHTPEVLAVHTLRPTATNTPPPPPPHPHTPEVIAVHSDSLGFLLALKHVHQPAQTEGVGGDACEVSVFGAHHARSMCACGHTRPRQRSAPAPPTPAHAPAPPHPLPRAPHLANPRICRPCCPSAPSCPPQGASGTASSPPNAPSMRGSSSPGRSGEEPAQHAWGGGIATLKEEGGRWQVAGEGSQKQLLQEA